MTITEGLNLWKLAKQINGYYAKPCYQDECFEIFEALLAQIMFGGSMRDEIIVHIKSVS